MQSAIQTAANFFQGAYYEFKLVSWPTKQQTIRLTAYVIGASLLVGFLVSLIDYLLTKGLSLFLR